MMVRPVNWLSLTLSLALLLWNSRAQSQLILVDSIITDQNISAYSADRTGNIFLGLSGGAIVKYNAQLDSLIAYNPTRTGSFDLLEAWHGFQVFAFNRKFQDFVLLDRFLSRESRYDLGSTGIFFVDLATVSSNQNLWLLEENGLRLMKYDIRSREIILSVTLETWLDNNDHDFCFIREYQNMLFITERSSGTYVFDNLGNFVKKLSTGKADHLSFHAEYVYFLAEDNLVKQSLYREEKIINGLPTGDYQGVLVYKNFIYLTSPRRVDLFMVEQD